MAFEFIEDSSNYTLTAYLFIITKSLISTNTQKYDCYDGHPNASLKTTTLNLNLRYEQYTCIPLPDKRLRLEINIGDRGCIDKTYI